MGTIVLHAGMSKAGSSSVQRWLEAHAALVREHGISMVRARVPPDSDRPVLEPYGNRGVSSGQFLKAYARRGGAPMVAAFGELLDEAAAEGKPVLVTCEGFGNLLAYGDEPFLTALERLAASHRVRLACYVRPQHTYLEAAWKQWGFRSGRLPSEYLREVMKRADHLQTHRRVTAMAPSVELALRPFRRDLLDGGSIVVDFAGRFLGMDELPEGSDTWWSNAGLPLDLVNLLRDAPEGVFYRGLADDLRYKRLKRAVAGWPVAESEQARRSRAVLHAYAWQQFEPSNVELVQLLGWATDHFIPPLEPDEQQLLGADEAKLELLDELWAPTANEAERRLFHLALGAAVTRRPRPTGFVDRWLPRPWAKAVHRTSARTRRRVRRALGAIKPPGSRASR